MSAGGPPAPLAIVTGVGPGTGASIARRFAAVGDRVAMLARNRARLAAIADDVRPDARQDRSAGSFLVELRNYRETW